MTLANQLMALQYEAMQRGWEECARWLAREVALMEKGRPKKVKRTRGRWVRFAATGERALVDAELVRKGIKEADDED